MRGGGHDPSKSATPHTPAFVALVTCDVIKHSTSVWLYVFLPSSLECNYGTFKCDERYSQSNKAFEKKQELARPLLHFCSEEFLMF